MAPRKKADWQREARVWKDVSPQELKYEQRSRESNLEANAAARAKLAQRGKEPELNVPDEVVEWFDRSRVAYLFALEQRQGKTKAGSPDDAIAKFHESYVKQKFERRGQFLWSVFHKVLSAKRSKDDDNDMGLSLLRKIFEKQLVQGEAGGGADGALLPPLQVVTIGSCGGAEPAGMLWVSKSFLRSRTMTCVMLDTDKDKGWRKTLPVMKQLLEGAKLMPAITLSLEYVDVAAELKEGKLQLKETTPATSDAAPHAGDREEVLSAEGATPATAGDGSVHGAEHGTGADGPQGAHRRSADVANGGEGEENLELVAQNGSALVDAGGACWQDAFKGPNAKAWNVLFGAESAKIDLVVLSYSIFESQEATRGIGWKFYEDMMLQAAPGTVFVVVDVLSRSRVYLDEMYEVLASAVEAARPKGIKSTMTLNIDDALSMHDGQLQGKLLDAGPSHAAIERVFRKLSLFVHPDKNPDDQERAQQAFNRLKEAKDTVIRGHESVKQEDGSVLLAPLSVHSYTASNKAHGKDSGLLRFDVGPCASIKAEVMVLVKGPLELAIKTRKEVVPKDHASGGEGAEGEGGEKEDGGAANE